VFKKVLIANRGEIALRIIRACRELGLTTVAVYSEADRDAVHVRFADEDVCIGPPSPSQSYLDFKRIISAAEVTNAEAIHPGYGFLAENADFAEICESCGIVFIGPKAQQIRQMGDKSVAKDTMRKAGVPVVPGSDGIVASYEDARDIAEQIGYPVMLKAVAGGGGKGMRLCYDVAELERNFHIASTEAANAFSCADLYLEKGIIKPHHVEIQIIGDHFGNYYHFGERDCSIQRRHQKLIEETPSPILTDDLRRRMGEAAINGAKSVGYLGVGTIEFLVDAERNFYFMEMNTRIQVEHPVTEEAYEIDLLKDQLRVALGEEIKYRQEELKPKWAVIECRINAEDVDNDFRPMPGRIEAINIPGGPGVRVDKAVYAGYFIPPYYDSMIAKLIVKGRTREEAITKMRGYLDEFIVEGVPTTIPIHREIFANPDFIAGNYSTAFIEQTMHWKRSSAAAKKKSVTFRRPGEDQTAEEASAPVIETVTTDTNTSN
jgi:acetyl-CoA carboxylase biotin carboxylase subunit